MIWISPIRMRRLHTLSQHSIIQRLPFFFNLHSTLSCMQKNGGTSFGYLVTLRDTNKTTAHCRCEGWKWRNLFAISQANFTRWWWGGAAEQPLFRKTLPPVGSRLSKLAIRWQTQTLRCCFKWGEGPSLSTVRLCSQWRPTLIAVICVQIASSSHPCLIFLCVYQKYTDTHWIKIKRNLKAGLQAITCIN